MNVKNLKKLGIENLSNGGKVVLDEVRTSYEYKDGERTDKVNGIKVTVVFPANRYEKHTITVTDPVDRLSAVLEAAPADAEICVSFQNPTVKVYRDRDGHDQISVKADSVQIVDDDAVLIE